MGMHMIRKIVGLSVALAVLVVTGCAGAAEKAGKQESGSDDKISIGNFADVTSWDPARSDIGFNVLYLSAIYDPLVRAKSDGSPEPALAKSWNFTDHHKTLEMKLRTGVTFSDGEKFDADAAVTSLRYLKKGSGSSHAYKNVSTIKKSGTNKIAIRLKRRDDALLHWMSIGRSYMMPPKKIKQDSLKKTPVGSGPYKLDESKSTEGSSYSFKRVKKYWDKDRFDFDKVKIRPINDASSMRNAMKSGQIDVQYAQPTDVSEAKKHDWNVAEKPLQWAGLNILDHRGKKLKPLGDVRVRRALSYAFDSENMLKSIGDGSGTVSNQVFPSDGTVHDKKLTDRYKYNVDKAKKLMAQAGYKKGFSVKLPMAPPFEPWQAVVKQSLKKINVDVTWDKMQYTDYQNKAGSYPLYIAVLSLDSQPLGTLDRQLTGSWWYNPKPDYGHDKKLSALAKKAQQSGGKQRTEALTKLNHTLVDQAWMIPWYQANGIFISKSDIKIKPIGGIMFPPLEHITKKK